MINKNILVLFFIAAFAINCASPVSVTKENTESPRLKKYKIIYVGWLQLREDDWKNYGYGSKRQWINAIKKHNISGLQTYLKEQLTGRKIYGAKSQKDVYRGTGALYMKFSFDKLDATDNLSSIDTLYVTAVFIDGKTKKAVYKASFAASSESPFPRNLKSASFDGRLDNEMYNLALGIAEKFK